MSEVTREGRTALLPKTEDPRLQAISAPTQPSEEIIQGVADSLGVPPQMVRAIYQAVLHRVIYAGGVRSNLVH